jgi:hypothetical protein
MEGGQRHHALAALPLVRRPGTRADLDECGKSRPPPGFDTRTVLPVDIRYTDSAIPSSRY